MAARSGTSRIFVWILLGLLILGLAGFGATNLTGNVRTVGEVGDEPIEAEDYARALQNELRRLTQERGSAVTFREAREAGLDQQILGRLIVEAALDDEADRLGISVGDGVLAEQIAQIGAFQGSDGSFDREAYRFALQNAGLSEAAFEEDLRDETARRILRDAVLAATPAPQGYVDALADFLGERRSFTFARLGADALDDPVPAPTESELRAFYEENTNRFMRPEVRRVTYAWLTPEMILDEVEVDETALRELYESREAQYRQPERRLVERLAYPDEAAARDALRAIEEGESSFEDEVAARGLTLPDTDLGDVTRRELGEAAEEVFAADTGEVVGPLPSSLGPALYRVNGALAAQETSFEEARPELREELATDRARRVIANQAESFDDLLAGGATLEELAQETDLRLGEIDWRPGLSEGIAAYPAFRETVQAATTDDFPEIIGLEDGGLFALRLEEIVEPAPAPLEDVEGEAILLWEQQQTRERLSVKAEDLAAALREGEDFSALELNGATEVEALARGEEREGVPRALGDTVFAMADGDVEIVPEGAGVLLVRLDAILPPDPQAQDVAALRAELSAQVEGALAEDVFELYARELQTRAGITLNQSALNAVHANFQ
ncbi:MAG: peptidyl-prolyl cis-trans isomerase [Rhodosalinus sp.]